MPSEFRQNCDRAPTGLAGLSHFAFCILHFAFFISLSSHSPLSADDSLPRNTRGEPRVAEQITVKEQTTVKKERYLGVITEPIPAALAAQLKDALPSGRGLLVKRVLPDSPAAKAGVQPFDVLSAADAEPLTTPDQFKELVTSRPSGRKLALELIRGAKVQTIDVIPAERTVSRLIHRHTDSDLSKHAVGADAVTVPKPADSDPAVEIPAYSVGVATRDGRNFQVEVRISTDAADDVTRKLSGTTAEITARLKPLPEAVQRSVLRQLARISEDRQTLRTVQFRFQPRRQGNRQVLAVTLRKPEADGAIKSFEWQQPMGDQAQSLPLDKLLDAPDFAAQLNALDPSVREKIESTLKTAALPAGTLKVEASQ